MTWGVLPFPAVRMPWHRPVRQVNLGGVAPRGIGLQGTHLTRSTQGSGCATYARPMIGKSGKPRIADVFCGVGGITKGLQRAGFYVIGVDIRPQPDYCGDEFYQMDARKFLRWHRRKFDAVWASPPCQAFSRLTQGNRAQGYFDNHVDMIPEVRDLLLKTGKPWAMENVPEAPLRPDLELCGLMFGLPLFRHRIFELHGFDVPRLTHPSHEGHRVKGYRRGKLVDGDIYGVYGSGGGKGQLPEWQTAMGIDWTSSFHSLAEACPPDYGQYIGQHLLATLST